MSTPRYCNLCNRNVIPRKKFNWLVFLFTLAIPYLIYYVLIKGKRCPICTGDSFSPAKASEIGK